MADQIQRVPSGLSAVLSTFGGTTPRLVAPEIHGSLELLQYYGLSQRQSLTATNAALAEGGTLPITLPTGVWCVLFGAEVNIVKTGTMTALRASLALVRGGGSSFSIASEELGPFGATETGTARMAFVAPYPMLLPPGSSIFCRPDIIGTDANASVGIIVEIGVLG